MNIAELSRKYEIPYCRIAAALKSGLVEGTKDGNKPWVIDESKFEAAIKTSTQAFVKGMDVTIVHRDKLKEKVLGTERFISKDSVAEYLELFKKRNQHATESQT